MLAQVAWRVPAVLHPSAAPPGQPSEERMDAMASSPIPPTFLGALEQWSERLARPRGPEDVRLAVDLWQQYPFTVGMIGNGAGCTESSRLLARERLDRAHDLAVSLLRWLCEKLNLDSTPILVSSQVCRRIYCKDFPAWYDAPFSETSAVHVSWPDCLGRHLSELPPGDRVAVEAAGPLIERLWLKFQQDGGKALEGIGGADSPNPKGDPLTDAEQQVYDVIMERGPVQGPEIIRLVGIEQSTLTRHVIPALKTKRGVRNKRSRGYYIDGQI